MVTYLMNNLFQKMDFTSHSGKRLDWKIECDALTDADIETLAFIISKRYKFCKVNGIPRGGLKLEKALLKYRDKRSDTFLIVDDVLTTGKSMEVKKKEIGGRFPRNIQGAVLFARGKCPDWITPVFDMHRFYGN